ncbi:MAG TPA: threonine synthase [Clostridia bacterium]|nr:threonine synthase [Clostridia bacterium]
MEYMCTICGKRERVDSLLARCACGGLWKLDYAPPPFERRLLDQNARGVFRYRAFLPLEDEAWRVVTLGEGGTPIVSAGGVLLKLEYLMPTLSFKDRGAAVLVARMKELGVARAVQDSSGNAGNSVAAYCARAGIACGIYVPEGTSPGNIGMIRAHGAECAIVPGTRDACAAACRARVENEGVYYASHVYNPYFYEGTKTYIYEIYEQLGRLPETLFLPVGNGTLFLGAMRAIGHLLDSGLISAPPRLIAVQSERCAPLYEAYAKGKDEPAAVKPLPTLAEGIAIGAPARGREILGYIRKYGAEVILAPEESIPAARDILAREGIFVEPTAAAVYAAYLEYKSKHGAPGECLLPASGAGLKSAH